MSAASSAEAQRGERRLLRRLQHHRVAGRQRRADLPDRHHQRVVPRRDRGDDAHRLAADDRGVARHVLARGLALHACARRRRRSAGCRPRRGSRSWRANRLADVRGLEEGELVGVRLDAVGELESSIPARSPGVRSNQLSKASCAAATARSTSSVPPTGTSARISSVAGLTIFSVLPSAAAVASPFTNSWNFFMASSPLLVGILGTRPLPGACQIRRSPHSVGKRRKRKSSDKERPKQGKARTRGCPNRESADGGALVPFARRVQEAAPCPRETCPPGGQVPPAGATAAGRWCLGPPRGTAAGPLRPLRHRPLVAVLGLLRGGLGDLLPLRAGAPRRRALRRRDPVPSAGLRLLPRRAAHAGGGRSRQRRGAASRDQADPRGRRRRRLGGARSTSLPRPRSAGRWRSSPPCSPPSTSASTCSRSRRSATGSSNSCCSPRSRSSCAGRRARSRSAGSLASASSGGRWRSPAPRGSSWAGSSSASVPSSTGRTLQPRKDASRWRTLLPWAAVALVAAAVVLPWTVRNAIRLGEAERRLAGGLAEPLPRFVPVTMYGPLNLALANHDGADGSFSADLLAARGDSAQLQLTNPEHLRFLLHGDRMAAAWIGDHPGAFARLVGRKWALYAGALRLGWTQWNLPGGLDRPATAGRPLRAGKPRRLALWLPALLAGASAAGAGRALDSDAGSASRPADRSVARRGGLLLRLRPARSAAPAALDGRRRDCARRLGARWLLARLPEDQRGLFRGAAWPLAGGDARPPPRRPRSRRRRPRPPLRGDRHDPPGSHRLDRDQPIHFRPLPGG